MISIENTGVYITYVHQILKNKQTQSKQYRFGETVISIAIKSVANSTGNPKRKLMDFKRISL